LIASFLSTNQFSSDTHWASTKSPSFSVQVMEKKKELWERERGWKGKLCEWVTWNLKFSQPSPTPFH